MTDVVGEAESAAADAEAVANTIASDVSPSLEARMVAIEAKIAAWEPAVVELVRAAEHSAVNGSSLSTVLIEVGKRLFNWL